ncbi:MAG TPA: DnaA/Hda family protein, partial [Polyangiaceae bacterium]
MQTEEQGGVDSQSPVAREPVVSSEAERGWVEAISFTREKSPASFDQWFSGVQFDGLTDGVLSLRARDEFVRQWVEDYFLPTLTERLRDHTGLSIQVRWIIDGGLEHPVADRPTPFSPVRPRPLSVRPPALLSGGDGATDGESGVHAVVPDMAGGARPIAVAAPVEGLNTKYTFANFVVGPSNQLAHAASMAAAGVGGRRHNPLFICGGTGLGKTHLVHAIAYRVREERPGARIVYISAERFVNEFVQSLQDQKMNDFRARYREKCDLLLVDDIHFLAGKTQTQEEFFHAFNALHQA